MLEIIFELVFVNVAMILLRILLWPLELIWDATPIEFVFVFCFIIIGLILLSGIETENQRVRDAKRSKPKLDQEPQRPELLLEQQEELIEKQAELLEPAPPAQQIVLKPKQEQLIVPEREVEVAPKLSSRGEDQPKLNLGALSSLIVEELARPEGEEGERLTVKKGVEALGGLDAIDAYLMGRSDKS